MSEALANAEEVAQSCRSDVLPNRLVAPPCKLSEGAADAYESLLTQVEVGLTTRGLGGEPAARARLQEELEAVLARGFAPILLFASEAVAAAARRNVKHSCRGSVIGSLVAYLLRI